MQSGHVTLVLRARERRDTRAAALKSAQRVLVKEMLPEVVGCFLRDRDPHVGSDRHYELSFILYMVNTWLTQHDREQLTRTTLESVLRWRLQNRSTENVTVASDAELTMRRLQGVAQAVGLGVLNVVDVALLCTPIPESDVAAWVEARSCSGIAGIGKAPRTW